MKNKTNEQLINELAEMRQRIAEFEKEETERRQAEEALRESESRYRLLAENVTDVIWTTDMNLRFTYVNPSVTRMLGYNVGEVVAQMVEKVLTPASRQVAMKAFTEELAVENMEHKDPSRSRTLELELACNDGSTVWTEAKMTFLRDPNGRPIGILGVARDITSRKRAEEELRRQALIFENIHDGIILTDLESRIIGWNPAAERMFGYLKDEVLGKTTGVLTTNVVDGTIHDGRWSGEINFIRKDGTDGVCETLILPMRDKHGNIIATVGVYHDITGRNRSEKELQQGLEKLQRTLEGTVNVLASAVEMRDRYTAGHQRRVTELACVIAKEMGLSKDHIEGVYRAGVIHDFGKISVPIEILSKPSKLTKNEFGIIKTHPQVSYDVLKKIEFPWPVAQIVLQHHERMDGSGYPEGLSGEGIFLEARILGVADAIEAMASHRPYRPAHSIGKALEEISQNRDVLYDPEVVDTCVTLFTEKGFKLE